MAFVIAFMLITGLPDDELPDVNAKIVAYARSKLGEQVGDGECASLAASAIEAAGASRGFGPSPWGEEIKNLRDVKPGDILQFDNVTFLQRRTRDDGAILKLTLKSPKHSAIVDTVTYEGREVFWTVLHQNAGFTRTKESDKKRVQTWTFALSERKSGVIRAFRPNPKRIPASPLTDPQPSN
jgi:hypothetical protein